MPARIKLQEAYSHLRQWRSALRLLLACERLRVRGLLISASVICWGQGLAGGELMLGWIRRLSHKVQELETRNPWSDAAAEAEKRGVVYKVERSAGYTLARYERSGLLDYETYRSIQEIGNKHKLDVVFTTEAVIRLVCEHSPDAKRILCHGTRNGAEQRWFRQHLPHAEILGTEISEQPRNSQ